MKKVDDLFKAGASNPMEISMLYDGRVGFVVPEYQRQYDWPKSNIERLHYDILNGFHRMSRSGDASAYTFLGTMILVKEETKEASFSGESVAIVDGQQRMTTLVLFACALTEALRWELNDTVFPGGLDRQVRTWMQKEVEERTYSLYSLAVGSQHVTPDENISVLENRSERREWRYPRGFYNGLGVPFTHRAIFEGICRVL